MPMLAKFACRFVARCAIVALVFGQLAMTVYACPVQGVPTPVAVTQSSFADDCAGMAAAAAAPANACEVHCAVATVGPASPYLPPVALTTFPVSAVPVAVLAASVDPSRAPRAALSGAPPLSLQFCRLLI